MLFKKFHRWTIWSQNIRPVWVKNCKERYLHSNPLPTKPVFPENKVLLSIFSFNTLSKLKDEPKMIHFLLKLIAS